MTNHLAVDQLISIRVIPGMESRLCLSGSLLFLCQLVVTSSITGLDRGSGLALVIVTHSYVFKQLFSLLDLSINIDIFNLAGCSHMLNGGEVTVITGSRCLVHASWRPIPAIIDMRLLDLDLCLGHSLLCKDLSLLLIHALDEAVQVGFGLHRVVLHLNVHRFFLFGNCLMINIVRVSLLPILQELDMLAHRVNPVENWIVESCHLAKAGKHFGTVFLFLVIRK